ncbi:MAG: C39 family peptidase, partial [Oscillospiraceae bacterium]|nr:C39 family peptidase [Oscillospiraceae bacterium]
MMRFSNKALRFISVLLALVLLFGSQAFAVNETVGEAAGQTTLPIADEPASDEPSTQAAAEPSAQEPATEEPTTQEPTTGEPTTEPPPEPVPGDINGDGRLTAADARTILRVSARLETCDDAAFALADINRDGKVTAWDARAALRLSAGIPADYVYPTMPQPEPEPEPQPLPAYWFIDAKPICQFPSFPTGCESVATAILLRYHGIQVTPAQFIDNYLDKGRTPYWSNGVCYSPDPQKVFLGNPRSKDGWGVHVGGIERALKKFVDQNRFDIVVPKGYT